MRVRTPPPVRADRREQLRMLFNSFAFGGFFVVVIGLYLLAHWLPARRGRLSAQNTLLLAASYFFYGSWDWRFLALIWLSTGVDFLCGWALDKRREDEPQTKAASHTHDYACSARARKVILFVSIAANLGILGFFKYFDFFTSSAASLLSSIGLPLEHRLLNLVLPVGISFYTFQTMSYTIDIYRGQLRAHKSLLGFALFVAFFPQLVAGPIVRAREFLPQVSRCRRMDLNQIYEGCYLILWGLFKKIVIADNLARLVDEVFGAQHTLLGGAVLVAIYAFAVQIYCDFSGYTDIARGCAKVLGFELRLNFNLPYFASNPAEFWRRWHISLSTWLRDYLYIPLGGSRKGPRRTCINLMLTMILGGLWHGAAWTFVLWGLYQGLLLIAHRAMMPLIGRLTTGWSAARQSVARWVFVFVFFQFVCFGWLIFRAESVEQIRQMLLTLLTPWPWWIASGANTLSGTGFWTLVGYSAPLFVVQMAQHLKGDLNVVLRMPALARGLAYALMVYGLILYEGGFNKPFIYFQF